jgi:hypothetical protein
VTGMADVESAPTLGEVLASRRRGRFVGRTSEVELFRAALRSGDPTFSLLYIHGPGGIGKTTLLDAFAEIATDAGSALVRLDGHETIPSPAAVLHPLHPVIGAHHALHASPSQRLVFLVDSYERFTALDDWFRTWLLPRLPAAAITVVAGRNTLSPAWRADPAWHDLLRVISLRNLDPQESRRYLDACGVDSAEHGRLVAITHGHPLGLSLLADLLRRGGKPGADPLIPDLVGALLRQFIDEVPNPLQRRALEASALARVTTEALLREVLEIDDAYELFAWLRGLSFMESGPEGLFPHDLARDVLDADLRWRDPAGYKQAFRAVRAHIHRNLKSAQQHEQQRALFDEKFLFRHLPGILSPVDWESWGLYYPEPAHAQDRMVILELVRSAEGDESAAIAERWLVQQPEGFSVIRRTNGAVQGFLGLLDLTRASASDIAADPASQAAWEYAQRHAPPRRNETVTQTRFVIDRDAYQDPSPTLNATPILTIQRYLQAKRLAWDFLTLAAPERWNEYFAIADLPRAVGADFIVGGRRYGLFAHDFRQRPVDAWLELVTERALNQDVAPITPSEPPLLLLSQQEFTDAVRQALHDLHRPDLLERNPLVRTRLVRDRLGDKQPRAAALDLLLREAVGTLREHPRDDKLFRAVDRTYLRPAATQERAAAALGLPFSTYRRHLVLGVDRVVRWLWDREVYGSTKQH